MQQKLIERRLCQKYNRTAASVSVSSAIYSDLLTKNADNGYSFVI